MKPLDVLLLFNEPSLARDDADWASEAGVLDSVEAVSEALAARGHSVQRCGISSVEQFIERLATLPAVDVVFNLFEGFGGVGRGEAEVTGLVELLGYPVTGSPAQCLSLVRDKARTKWLLAGAGVATPPFRLIGSHDPLNCDALAALLAEGPVIVKPAHEDGSLGIDSDSVVTQLPALVRQIEHVRDRYGAVLVERFIVGREFNAAILALPDAELLPLAEIEFSGPSPPGWQIVTYDAKWDIGSAADRSTPPRCPALVEPATAERIGQAALAAFQCTGCRGYARVDLRMDGQGQVYVLEVNGNPDIGPGAGLARALTVAGISYQDFAERVVRSAVAAGSAHPPAMGNARVARS
jgi:D-alanine-D-alanine ligase